AVRSLGAVLAFAGLQVSLLPCAYPQAQDNRSKSKFFDWENLVSDIAGVADRTDPNLANPWGLALNPNSNIFWVADNHTGVSTLYRPDGTIVPLVVTIPPESQSAPTGTVFNLLANITPSAFHLSNGKPAIFIFDGEDGRITAWNDGTAAEVQFDNSSSGAIYK